jgi:hypothetical protein
MGRAMITMAAKAATAGSLACRSIMPAHWDQNPRAFSSTGPDEARRARWRRERIFSQRNPSSAVSKLSDANMVRITVSDAETAMP